MLSNSQDNLIGKKTGLILGIESSCDETAASVVADGRHILSNVIASQADLHQNYGGVVPELASRMHVQAVIPTVKKALADAQVDLADLDAIAVTRGPGLVGALLVGISAAKGLALASGLPLVGVQHIAGHMAANYLSDHQLEPPFICLVASGAHSHLVLVETYTKFKVLARSRDDAAGEAFDKIARALGLGYPGGPLIDKTARGGDASAVELPRTRFEDSLDFSFSGLKTATLNQLNRLKQQASDRKTSWQELLPAKDFAASFQKAVVDVLVDNTFAALEKYAQKQLALAGGVAANSLLRETVEKRAAQEKIRLSIPPLLLCTDNAAMIAAAGYYAWKNGDLADMALNADPSLDLPE